MKGSLDLSDSVAWWRLEHYSADVARRLRRAYRTRTRGQDSAASLASAAGLVAPLLVEEMAAPQYARVCYLLARREVTRGAPSTALKWLAEACEAAAQVDDVSALSELFYRIGAAHNMLTHYRQAADAYRTSLTLYRAAESRGQPVDLLTALPALTHEANMRYHLGDFETAQMVLDEATTLIPDGAGRSLEAATIEWVRAMLVRLSGDGELALALAHRAAAAYLRIAPTASAVRILTVAADAALDRAQATDAGATLRSMMLEMAAAHLDRALSIAVELDDTAGEVLTRLVRVRASGLRGDNIGRIGLIEVLANEGKKLRDDALLARAFTELGGELVARGEESSGLNVYKQVFHLLDSSDMPALAIPARKAYHLEREWRA